jgi:hypothetical protein
LRRFNVLHGYLLITHTPPQLEKLDTIWVFALCAIAAQSRHAIFKLLPGSREFSRGVVFKLIVDESVSSVDAVLFPRASYP